MGKKTVEVTFETITPLWTGNAWQEMTETEIRPSSLIGSLRFWFETIMYSIGILTEEDFNPKTKRFEKEISKEDIKDLRRKYGNEILKIMKDLIKERNIPISSAIFGATNWKSLIEIKDIQPIEIEETFFSKELNLKGKRICIKKDKGEVFNCNERNNDRRQYSIYFFPLYYFYGRFKANFLVERAILDGVFLPLLSFMHEFGFWGGKWNLGFGRLKVVDAKTSGIDNSNWRRDVFELEILSKKNININNLIKELIVKVAISEKEKEKQFEKIAKDIINNIKENPQDLKLIKLEGLSHSYSIAIKDLLGIKYQIRKLLRHECEQYRAFKEQCLKKKELDEEVQCGKKKYKCKDIATYTTFRHELLGEKGEGSKILPYYHSEKNLRKETSIGFLSLDILLKLRTKGERNDKGISNRNKA